MIPLPMHLLELSRHPESQINPGFAFMVQTSCKNKPEGDGKRRIYQIGC